MTTLQDRPRTALLVADVDFTGDPSAQTANSTHSG